MPSAKQATVPVTCPKCGHTQAEPRSAYSTVCKKCHEHFRLQDKRPPAPIAPKPAIEVRRVHCFQCGTELEAPIAAASTMCKRCSSHVDLGDYTISQTFSKNFRTYGRLVIEEKGYLLNTETRVGEAIIKGRVIGKLAADRILEIHSTASIKGSITGGRLVVPAGHRFRWPQPLQLSGADLGGELVASMRATGTVVLRSTARMFGDIEAANLVVEAGAVFVGQARIGQRS